MRVNPLIVMNGAIALLVLGVVVAGVRAGVAHARRRGWIRSAPARGRAGTARGAAAVGVGMVEELFAPARHQARQQVEECERVEKRAPVPGDGLGDRTTDGRFHGRLTIRRP
jgi:hypothetical protein